MERKIQVRRGLKQHLPILDIAELGFTTDTHELFVGTGDTPVKVYTNILEDMASNEQITVAYPNKTEVTGLVIHSQTQTGFTVSWNDPISQTNTVQYKVYIDNQLKGTVLAKQNNFASYVFSGLSANTNYAVRVTTVDGNALESAGTTITGFTIGPNRMYFNANGFVKTPAVTFDALEITSSIAEIGAVIMLVDARSGSNYVQIAAGGSAAITFQNPSINGEPVRSGVYPTVNTPLTWRLETGTTSHRDDMNFNSDLLGGAIGKQYLYVIRAFLAGQVVLHYDFTNQFAGNVITDKSGKGNHGTLSGGTWL